MEAQKEEFVILGDGVLVKYNGEAQNVVVPDKVKYISDAFSGNATVRSVRVGNRVRTVGEGAFEGCRALSEVILGAKVQTIEKNAFYRCTGLISVYLPKSLTFVATGAFSGTDALANVYYAGTSKSYSSIVREKGNEALNNSVIVSFEVKY